MEEQKSSVKVQTGLICILHFLVEQGKLRWVLWVVGMCTVLLKLMEG